MFIVNNTISYSGATASDGMTLSSTAQGSLPLLINISYN
jgi:hypothetical protein